LEKDLGHLEILQHLEFLCNYFMGISLVSPMLFAYSKELWRVFCLFFLFFFVCLFSAGAHGNNFSKIGQDPGGAR